MRKVIITLDAAVVSQSVPEHFFDVLDSLEGQALLRLDFEKGFKIGVVDLKVKEGYSLKDIVLPDGWEILSVLRANTVYTCLIRIEYKGKKVNVFKLFDVDVIFDLPFIFSKEKVVFTFIADNENVKKLLTNIKSWGVIKNISFQPATFFGYNILSCLTERQKEVLTAAKKNGYYDVPRKISTKELSQKLGISRSTTVEHLRKAEKRIISCILEGY